MNKYLKFEYWNTCDLGNIYYQGGQHFWFYLNGDVLEPFHEDIEDGQEDGEGDFVPTYRRQMKRYKIRTALVPDYLIDAIQRMKLHDHIELTFKTGEVEQIYNLDIEVEWQFEKYCWQGTVTMTFDMDEKVVLGSCCDNLTVGDVIPPEPIPDLYWVADTGSDESGDGSYQNPWATLGYATTQATTSGDVIHVKVGTITETVQSSVAVGVSIIGAGDTSIIKAGAALNPMFIFHSAVQGTNGNQSISYVKLDGDLIAQRCLTVKCRSNVIMHHCTVVDFLGDNASVIDFDGRASGSAEPTIYATGNQIYECTFTNNSDDFPYVADVYYAYSALSIGGQNGMLIHDNIIDNVTGGRYGYGIKGIGGYFRGCKIYDNIISTNLRDETDVENYSFAIELWGLGKGGNEIYGNTCNGAIDLAGYGWNDAFGYGFALKVYDNTIILTNQIVNKNHESGLLFESGFSGGVYIYHNFVKNFSTGLVISLTENSLVQNIDGFYVYYNIFTEIANNGATMTGYGMQYTMVKTSASYTPAVNDFRIWNNIFYRADGTVQVYGINMVAKDSVTGVGADWSNISVNNNIWFNVYTPCKWEDQTIDFVEIDKNISHNATNNNRFVTCTVTNDTVVAMLTGDPLFASAVDYHLQAGSPAINAGVALGQAFITTDYAGDPIGAVPEIGCYKY
jgi:hypothetical protein